MCYFVYIATDEVLETPSFVPNETLLYLEKPSENELEGLKEKFLKKIFTTLVQTKDVVVDFYMKLMKISKMMKTIKILLKNL